MRLGDGSDPPVTKSGSKSPKLSKRWSKRWTIGTSTLRRRSVDGGSLRPDQGRVGVDIGSPPLRRDRGGEDGGGGGGGGEGGGEGGGGGRGGGGGGGGGNGGGGGGVPYKTCVMFVDNAGADVLLGMLPLAGPGTRPRFLTRCPRVSLAWHLQVLSGNNLSGSRDKTQP